MNVLLSTLNSKFIHSSLALRYLRAYGRDHDQAYEVVEYTINMPILHILNDITTYQAKVIGFACYIWNIEMTLHLVAMIKSVAPQTKIVLGGPEVSYNADEILMAHPSVDFIVQGEGEEAFSQLVSSLSANEDWTKIVGIRGRQNGSLAGSTEVVEVQELGSIPFPYSEEDMTDLEHKIIYYESSRGCPFSCQYCLSGNRNTVRFFPLERTLQELQWFIDQGVKQVKFVDRTFNCAPHHHLPIMNFIASAQTETNFHLEMEAVLMGEKEVDILSHTVPGRIQIEVGVQSTHQKTLEAIHRRNDWDHIKEVIRPIIASGRTHVHMDLIIGLPHENYARFGQSFDDLFSLQPHALQLGFLKLLKGSGVRQMAEYQYVYDPLAPYEVLGTHVMSYQEIRFLKHFEDVFERFYNSERYRTVFGYIAKRLLERGDSAFTYFEQLTKAWLEEENQQRKLNDKDQILFLYRYFKKLGDTTAMELLQFDTLKSFKGKIREAAMGLPIPSKEELQEGEAFWRSEELVRQYIPDFSFKEWRHIRQDYCEMPISVATARILGVIDLPDTVEDDSVTIVIDVKDRVRPFVRPVVVEK